MVKAAFETIGGKVLGTVSAASPLLVVYFSSLVVLGETEEELRTHFRLLCIQS